MTGQYRVDRPSNPGNDTEWFGTDKTAALARETELRQRGCQHVIAWFDAAEYTPTETTAAAVGWSDERPVALIDRIRGLAGRVA